MPKERDITGQRFGRLVAIRRDENNIRYWYFRCDCGLEKRILKGSVILGRVKSCGCRGIPRDITNQKFGRLTAVRPIGDSGSYWEFRCECGSIKEYPKSHVLRGKLKSCGCINKERLSVGIAKRKYPVDITGMRFYNLVALEQAGESDFFWRFKCDCGGEIVSSKSLVFRGRVKACGCKRSDSVNFGPLRQRINTVSELHTTWFDKKDSLTKANTSGCTGVSRGGANGEFWCARIGFKGKSYYLGSSRDIEKAIKLRKEAEKHIVGPFLEWYNETYKKNKV